MNELKRADSVLRKFEIFVVAAVVAAHATNLKGGFRGRDVRFLLELYSNWIEHTLEGSVIEVRNTQIQRYLEELASSALAKKSTRSKAPIYQLTRAGILELVQRLVQPRGILSPEQFLFVFYFVHSYGDVIRKLIAADSQSLPTSLRIELEMLLDSKRLIELEIQQRELQLRKLSTRAQGALEADGLAKQLFSDRKSIDEISTTLEKRHPYELSNQKPLSELLGKMPSMLARWELEMGSGKRAIMLWAPCAALLANYIKTLKDLLRTSFE